MTDDLTTQQIDEAHSRRIRSVTVKVTLPEVGEVNLVVRKLSAADVMAIVEVQNASDRSWEQLRRSIYRRDGTPLFGPESRDMVMSWDWEMVEPIVRAMNEVNPPANERAIAKN